MLIYVYLHNMVKYILPPNAGTIDKIFCYPICSKIDKIFIDLGMTPNIITTMTLVIRIYISYNILVGELNYFDIILYLISWILDGLDGFIARNHNMKSEFGAIYDPLVDVVTHTILFIVLKISYYKKNKMIWLFFVIYLLITFFITIKADKKDYNKLKIWEKSFFKLYESFGIKKVNNINGFVIGPGFMYSFFILILIYTYNK